MAERVVLERFPEVETVVSRTGRAEIATDPMGVEISDTYLILAPPQDLALRQQGRPGGGDRRSDAASVPGAVFSYSQPIELRVAELISGVRSDIAVHLYGDDLGLLKREGR